MGISGLVTDAGGEGGGGNKRPPLPKICHTHPTTTKLGAVIPYLKKFECMNHVTHSLSSADVHIFTGNQQILLYQEMHI